MTQLFNRWKDDYSLLVGNKIYLSKIMLWWTEYSWNIKLAKNTKGFQNMSLPGLKFHNGFSLLTIEDKFYIIWFILSLWQYFRPFSPLLCTCQPHLPIIYISCVLQVCLPSSEVWIYYSNLQTFYPNIFSWQIFFLIFWPHFKYYLLRETIPDVIMPLSHWIQYQFSSEQIMFEIILLMAYLSISCIFNL